MARHFLLSQLLIFAGMAILQSVGAYELTAPLRIFADDHEMLRHGMVIFDALYAWCQSEGAEMQYWPPTLT